MKVLSNRNRKNLIKRFEEASLLKNHRFKFIEEKFPDWKDYLPIQFKDSERMRILEISIKDKNNLKIRIIE